MGLVYFFRSTASVPVFMTDFVGLGGVSELTGVTDSLGSTGSFGLTGWSGSIGS